MARQPVTDAAAGHGNATGSAGLGSAASSIPGHSWFDAYSLKAQWAPVLFAAAPMAVAVPVLVGASGLIGSAAMLACLPPVLAQTARNRGKALEPALWASWGGPPTTRLLRHRDGTVSEHTKLRYFAALSRSANIVRPTPEEELADPVAADAVYQAAGDWLRPMTRAHAGTSLVAAKNAAYGLARNLLGIRWVGFALAVATSVGMAAVAYQRWNSPAPDFTLAASAALAGVGCAALWAVAVNGPSVRSAADAYARALLECCDTLPIPPPVKPPASRRKKADSDADRPDATLRTTRTQQENRNEA